MRTAFRILLVLNLALALASAFMLPERAAIHFGPGGAANGFGPAWVNALVFGVMCSLVFLSLEFSGGLLSMFPPQMINLPNRAYWLSPENLPRTRLLFQALMRRFGVSLLLFLFVAQVLVIGANSKTPPALDERWFLLALGLFLVHTLWWVICVFRTFNSSEARQKAPAAGHRP